MSDPVPVACWFHATRTVASTSAALTEGSTCAYGLVDERVICATPPVTAYAVTPRVKRDTQAPPRSAVPQVSPGATVRPNASAASGGGGPVPLMVNVLALLSPTRPIAEKSSYE